jgi:lipid-binding SYLF domain-containing protein
MRKTAFQRIVLVLVTAGMALTGSAGAEKKKGADEHKLIVDAGKVFERFLNDRDLDWLRKNKDKAKGFLISPEIVKAGIVFGGKGGRAVLVAKGEKGWMGPAFYNIGTASVGFQAGVSVMEAVAVVMSQKALDSLMSSSLKLGVDATVAAGPVGVGAAAGGANADFIIYSKAQGLYGGANFEGAVVKVSEDGNKAYYGQDVSPIDIMVKGTVKHNKSADAPLFSKITVVVK